MINVQEIKVYLAVFAAQSTATMVHTPGAYYSTNQGTAAYQRRVLAFIGNRRATKEPTPICLLTTKTWEWLTGDGLNNAEKFNSFCSYIANQG
jgi:hypothetical protein